MLTACFLFVLCCVVNENNLLCCINALLFISIACCFLYSFGVFCYHCVFCLLSLLAHLKRKSTANKVMNAGGWRIKASVPISWTTWSWLRKGATKSANQPIQATISSSSTTIGRGTVTANPEKCHPGSEK